MEQRKKVLFCVVFWLVCLSVGFVELLTRAERWREEQVLSIRRRLQDDENYNVTRTTPDVCRQQEKVIPNTQRGAEPSLSIDEVVGGIPNVRRSSEPSPRCLSEKVE